MAALGCRVLWEVSVRGVGWGALETRREAATCIGVRGWVFCLAKVRGLAFGGRRGFTECEACKLPVPPTSKTCISTRHSTLRTAL